ncbi:MAG: 50S ribosomal protein L16 [Candidatus Micrarchaeota archaeon]
MAGIRPAKTIRDLKAQPWTRTSRRRPRKSFVKGVPHTKIRQFNMGSDKRYDFEITLVAREGIQLRDNSIEAARMAANKVLEKEIPANYFLQVVSYPHVVLREHSAMGVAGADRISKGMKRAFGKPKGRLARVRKGKVVFLVRVYKTAERTVKKALKRASIKLSGHYDVKVRDITKDAINLARSTEAEVIEAVAEIAPIKEAKVEGEAVAAIEGEAGEKKEDGKPAAADEKKPEAKGKAAEKKK